MAKSGKRGTQAVVRRGPMARNGRPVPTAAAHRPVAVVEAVMKGNRIKQRLDELALTQEEGAAAAGVSYRHFNRIVLSRCDPSLLIVARLEAVLHAPYAELFTIDIKTRARRAKDG